MHNDKKFHVVEREEYRQRRGIEVDLMQVSCKLQTFWHSGSTTRILFRRTETLTQTDFTAFELVFCRKRKLYFRSLARQGVGIG